MKRIVAAGLAFAALLIAPLSSQEIIEQVLVKVNGEILTKTDLEARQIAALRDQERVIDPERLKSDTELQKMLREVTPGILSDAIDEMLLVQRGRETGKGITDAQFKQWVDELKKTNKLETDAQFMAALKGEGMTLEQFRRMFERRVIVSQVVRAEVSSKVALTEQEAKEYYARHPAEFTPPPTVTLREVFLNVIAQARDGGVSFSAADDETAAAKAKTIRDRAAKGEPFEKLVAEFSDGASKANGGLIGPIVRNELAPALQKLLEGMKAGDISEPIRTARGYQIIKLELASAATPSPYEEVRDLIADKVAEQKGAGEQRKLVERLRATAIIEWKNEELKKLYEQHLARSGTVNGLR
ncbi:MAG: peptidylprolyl isomerase [Acidobacteriota bacterium]|nr:peptidylprolyl isomerase [Acidobacteriota bacterium]